MVSGNGQNTVGVPIGGTIVQANPNTPVGAKVVHDAFVDGTLTDTTFDKVQRALNPTSHDPNTENGHTIIAKLIGVTSPTGKPLYSADDLINFVRRAEVSISVSQVKGEFGQDSPKLEKLGAEGALVKSDGLLVLDQIATLPYIHEHPEILTAIQDKKDLYLTRAIDAAEIAVRQQLGMPGLDRAVVR